MGLVFCFATYARKTVCLARKFSHCKCPVWFLFEPEKLGKLMKIFANTYFHSAIEAIFKLDRAMQITWKNLELASSLESLNQRKSCRFPQCAQTLRNSWSKLKELPYIKKKYTKKCQVLLIALHCATIHEYGVGNCRLVIGLLGSWQEGLGSGFGWVTVLWS